MTPEQRALEMFRPWDFSTATPAEDIAAMSQSIREAILQEREACAVLAGSLHAGPNTRIAAAIRARETP